MKFNRLRYKISSLIIFLLFASNGKAQQPGASAPKPAAAASSVSKAETSAESSAAAERERNYSGPGGVTPPGGNTGPPGSFVPGFAPDLRKYERMFTIALLVNCDRARDTKNLGASVEDQC